jgi:23S rRNA (guanosine2251-2'-O)-methyltransferase
MVHRRNRQTRGRKLLGSHNRSWIWGRNVVAETVRAGRWPIVELALSRKLDPKLIRELEGRAAALGVPVTLTDDAALKKLCRAGDHQGCAAQMAEFPYENIEALRRRSNARSLLLVLDRIQDPFNFGAMIRTAAGLGMDGVIIGAAEQTEVNSQVVRSSAGAVNQIPICRVEDLRGLVQELRDLGWKIWAASERGATPLSQTQFRPPMGLIIGNEGTGIAPELLALCTGTVRIPMHGQMGSLNAAVSAGILCYEMSRVRETEQRRDSEI